MGKALTKCKYCGKPRLENRKTCGASACVSQMMSERPERVPTKPCKVCGLPMEASNQRIEAHPHCKNATKARKYRARTSEAKAKTCLTCKQRKPASEYYGNRWAADGLSSSCKECMKAYQREKGARPAEVRTIRMAGESCDDVNWNDLNHNPFGGVAI